MSRSDILWVAKYDEFAFYVPSERFVFATELITEHKAWPTARHFLFECFFYPQNVPNGTSFHCSIVKRQKKCEDPKRLIVTHHVA